MKKIILLLLLVCGYSHAQTSAKERTKEEFAKMTQVKELIELPQDVSSLSFSLLGTVKQQRWEVTGTANDLSAEARKLLASVDPGTKVYLDVKYETQSSKLVRVNAIGLKVKN